MNKNNLNFENDYREEVIDEAILYAPKEPDQTLNHDSEILEQGNIRTKNRNATLDTTSRINYRED